MVSSTIPNPEDPEYSFPKKEKDKILSDVGIDYYLATFFLLGIVFLAIIGYAVETTTLGDKTNMKNSLVEAVDEDNPE